MQCYKRRKEDNDENDETGGSSAKISNYEESGRGAPTSAPAPVSAAVSANPNNPFKTAREQLSLDANAKQNPASYANNSYNNSGFSNQAYSGNNYLNNNLNYGSGSGPVKKSLGAKYDFFWCY